MTNTHYLTKERLVELTEELHGLKTKKRIEVANRLKTAKDYGDLSENSEYTEAKSEQEQVETRIFELEEILKNVAIIKPSSGTEIVQVGSKVTCKKGDRTTTYHIVGSNETRPEEGKISNESPLGQSLLGKRAGDSVVVKTPSGMMHYEITHVE